jgi:hypothetical protein
VSRKNGRALREFQVNEKSGSELTSDDFDKEAKALRTVLAALSPLSEETRAFIHRVAGERLRIVATVNDQPPGPEHAQMGRPSSSSQGVGLSEMSPKEFLKNKKPVSELQRIVCLAYYLTHGRSTAHFKTADLTKLNTEAAGGRFSNASTTVNNATNQSHFLAPAGKGGLKQITPHGEEYVEALPDQEAAKRVVLQKAARAKGMKKRRSKGKG